MWQSLQILNDVNNFNFETITLTLKQIFWKTKTFFKKLEYCFLVESNKVKNVIFPYKASLSEVKFKTNRTGSIKWTYHKERSFVSNYFIFLKIVFQFKNLLQRVDLMHQLPKCPYSYFMKALEFYLKVLFLLSILNCTKIWLVSQAAFKSNHF